MVRSRRLAGRRASSVIWASKPSMLQHILSRMATVRDARDEARGSMMEATLLTNTWSVSAVTA